MQQRVHPRCDTMHGRAWASGDPPASATHLAQPRDGREGRLLPGQQDPYWPGAPVSTPASGCCGRLGGLPEQRFWRRGAQGLSPSSGAQARYDASREYEAAPAYRLTSGTEAAWADLRVLVIAPKAGRAAIHCPGGYSGTAHGRLELARKEPQDAAKIHAAPRDLGMCQGSGGPPRGLPSGAPAWRGRWAGTVAGPCPTVHGHRQGECSGRTGPE
jgi:hypothetical protein